MRRAAVLVAILLSHTFTICVRAGGYDERGLTDRTLDQIGGPSGVKRGAVEESGRLDPATLRSRWEAAARGDAPESKPAASAVPEEERLAKPSDEIGRAPAGNETNRTMAPAGNETNRTMAPAGNETNRTDTTEESVTGGEDSSPRGEGEASPTESIEDLEAEWDLRLEWGLRPAMDAAEARAKQAREADELERLADEAREEFGSSMCKRSESALISEPLAFFGDEDTRPGYLVSFGDSKDAEIVTKWCYSSGYTLHQPWELYPDEFGWKTPENWGHSAAICFDQKYNRTRWVSWLVYGMAPDPPYHRPYNTSHKYEGVPPNTIERVGHLLTLTIKHHGPWIEAVTLASNSWDLSRIVENKFEFHESEWIANATAVISEIKRHSKSIILRTSTLDYRYQHKSAFLSDRLNCAMRKLSRTLKIPLVDVDECLLGVPSHRRVINGDKLHQSTLCSVLIAGCVRAEVERSGFGMWYGWAFRDEGDSGDAKSVWLPSFRRWRQIG